MKKFILSVTLFVTLMLWQLIQETFNQLKQLERKWVETLNRTNVSQVPQI
jgi:hypothetical protein